jgi:Putative peptidoglycan binding domain
MYDSVDIAQIPPGPEAVAGYVDGGYRTAGPLAVRFPHARLVTIAVTAASDADVLDIETGDAEPAGFPAWHARQQARGVARPAAYASVSVMHDEVVPRMQAAGIGRSQVRLWTAHYAGLHICGPGSCGELAADADGTQWTRRAWGRNLDQSALVSSFFTSPPPPSLSWQEAMMRALTDVRQGDTGEDVRTVQGLLCARGHTVTIDGAFGPATAAAVREVQDTDGLTADGTVGPATWPALLALLPAGPRPARAARPGSRRGRGRLRRLGRGRRLVDSGGAGELLAGCGQRGQGLLQPSGPTFQGGHRGGPRLLRLGHAQRKVDDLALHGGQDGSLVLELFGCHRGRRWFRGPSSSDRHAGNLPRNRHLMWEVTLAFDGREGGGSCAGVHPSSSSWPARSAGTSPTTTWDGGSRSGCGPSRPAPRGPTRHGPGSSPA